MQIDSVGLLLLLHYYYYSYSFPSASCSFHHYFRWPTRRRWTIVRMTHDVWKAQMPRLHSSQKILLQPPPLMRRPTLALASSSWCCCATFDSVYEYHTNQSSDGRSSCVVLGDGRTVGRHVRKCTYVNLRWFERTRRKASRRGSDHTIASSYSLQYDEIHVQTKTNERRPGHCGRRGSSGVVRRRRLRFARSRCRHCYIASLILIQAACLGRGSDRHRY